MDHIYKHGSKDLIYNLILVNFLLKKKLLQRKRKIISRWTKIDLSKGTSIIV